MIDPLPWGGGGVGSPVDIEKSKNKLSPIQCDIIIVMNKQFRFVHRIFIFIYIRTKCKIVAFKSLKRDQNNMYEYVKHIDGV